MSLGAGRRFGHYEILAPLGAGGMGEVYRARDHRLKRDVAIKVLPETLARNPDALERFEREALAVAALSHPNILSIHDFGTEGEVSYSVMELLEGQTLRAALDSGPPSEAQVLEWSTQIARGLAAAHEKGIVHRDLKPENLFVTKGGHLKILDFGLAKVAKTSAAWNVSSAPTESGHTEPGTLLGTVGYMSPEQVRGLPVDHRSDIFSFGAVLYEMLSGRKAFRRETAGDTIAAILKEEPPEPTASADRLSPEISWVMRRCLAKSRDDRFQSASDLVSALSGSSSGSRGERPFATSSPVPVAAGLKGIHGAAAVAVVVALLAAGALYRRSVASRPAAGPSIAVLPFLSLTGEKEHEVFADGISDDLINLLSKMRPLRVIARTSSFSFKGKTVDIATIARTLKVSHVLEGSIRWTGDRIRVAAHLIRASDSSDVWSETYDRPLGDVFVVQDEISAAVAAQLEVKLLGAAPKTKPVDPKAYGLLLQAKQLGDLGTKEGYEQARELLEKVLVIAPDYPRAWNEMAFYHLIQAFRGWSPRHEALEKARQATARALAIDPREPRSHARLADISLSESDLAGAARHAQRALELDPACSPCLSVAANLLAQLGRTERGVEVYEFLTARNPVAPIELVNLGLSYLEAGSYDKAISTFKTVLQLTPGRRSALHGLIHAYLLSGRPEEAMVSIPEQKDEKPRAVNLAMALHALGRKAEAEAALANVIETYGQEDPYDVACVLAFRGERDAAFSWLEKWAARSGALSALATAPLLRNLHADRRWLPLLRRFGYAPEQLAVIRFDLPALPKEAAPAP